MTMVSIVSVAIALSVGGLIATAYWNLRVITSTMLNQTDMVVYCLDATADDTVRVSALTKQIRALPAVGMCTFVSRSAAWQRFTAHYGADMVAAVDSNPFPASFELVVRPSFKQNSVMTVLQRDLAQLPGIESVTYSSAWINKLERFRVYFFSGSLVVGLLVLIIMQVIIANTIKLTIYARRELISTMRYVGATDGFIQAPFIIEGVVQGGIGGTLGFLLIDILRLTLQQLPLSFIPRHGMIVLVPLGMLFGLLGSIGAIRKFLR